jgi:hypothetical protein
LIPLKKFGCARNWAAQGIQAARHAQISRSPPRQNFSRTFALLSGFVGIPPWFPCPLVARFARLFIEKENLMKRFVKLILALSIGVFAGTAALADGYKNCTKISKASWKPASDAEAQAKAAGYEVRRTKVEGSCYEVYGVKEGKLYELFYSPEDLSLKHTTAK